MVDVTRDTFAKICPQLIRDIGEAEFVGVDFEFTGLKANFRRYLGEQHAYAGPEGGKESVQQFLPIQLGICTARREARGDSYAWVLRYGPYLDIF